MKKIVMLPLDERPCNYDYPKMMPNADYSLLIPPKTLMGDKKRPGDMEGIKNWLLENIDGADCCILSLDTLIYGGIVPSRLHEEKVEVLLERAKTVELLREKNPKMKFYVFQLIMRCPDYSLSDEEPDYYDFYGRDLHLYGRYTHLEQTGSLTETDKQDFNRIKEILPSEVLEDFIGRRKKNLQVLIENLRYVKDGTVDFFIVPQDDAAVYGFTSMDQILVRKYLKENFLHMKTAMYPSADDTGLILLGRAVSELNGGRPRIYVHYASTKAESVVPWFEDRPLGETIKYHILSVGGQQVYSLPEADIVLAVNMGSEMLNVSDGGYVKAYDVERNLAEFTAFIRYALEQKKIVSIGDVAGCNGSDGELLHLLQKEDLLLKIHAYAGWNTSSNTLGTTICQAVLYYFGRDEWGRKSFLLHRYYEDMGYMGYVRKYIIDNVLPGMGLNNFRVDGKKGKVAKMIRKELIKYMTENFPELAEEVETVEIEQPWNRMFETDVKLKIKK